MGDRKDKIDTCKLDITWNSGSSEAANAEVVSIVGQSRKIARTGNEIPLVYMNEASEMGVKQWYDSHGSLEDARISALKMQFLILPMS